MIRPTTNPRTMFTRLVEYLQAEVQAEGEVVTIKDYGNGRRTGEFSELRLVGRERYWDAIGHLLFVATTLEEQGGMGCTWAGLHSAAGFLFELRHERCKTIRPADVPCPMCGLDGGDLMLPHGISGFVDAMLSRLSNPAFYDRMLDDIVEKLP
jgi:hypothetical protein